MKNLLWFLCALCTTVVVQAQGSFTAKAIDASEVPQVVLDAQSSLFSGSEVDQWRIQEGEGGRGNSGTNYIATFVLEGQRTRARYSEDGKGIVAVTYFKANELPSAIQESASTNYSDFQLVRGEFIRGLQEGKNVYRISLRDGAKRLVVFVDENGNEIKKENVPEEMQDVE